MRNGKKQKNFRTIKKKETIVKQEYINEKERRKKNLGARKKRLL